MDLNNGNLDVRVALEEARRALAQQGDTNRGTTPLQLAMAPPSNVTACASLSSGNRKPPQQQQRVRKDFLPASAPVSSLLPPIPTTPNLQAQLLALLASRQGAPVTAPIHSPPPQLHNPAVASLLAAQAPAGVPVPGAIAVPNIQLIPPNIQNWSLEQLVAHVQMLNQLNQPVPQSVAMLLAEARRRDQKKDAKRLANRKSASSSRARKKELVKEMTELNARLKRQALILALLPDLVVVIDVQGKITFCSAQVERALQHKVDDLIGVQLSDMLVPSSRAKLANLVKELIQSQKGDSSNAPAVSETVVSKVGKRPRDEGAAGMEEEILEKDNQGDFNENKRCDVDGGDGTQDGSASKGAAVVSEAVASDPSLFPLSVVKVEAPEGATASDENGNSDLSASNVGCGSKHMSSLTNTGSLSRSPTASSLCNSGSDGDGGNKKEDGDKDLSQEKGDARKSGKDLPSSDTSNSSSLSTNAKKLQKANANLVRNVRWHNKKMKDKAAQLQAGYKDDVIGADVTANNATARLSSLRHRMESSSEEDSGYRESNESREETSSSSSDLSDSNGRRKPLAPTCNLCLIRKDSTTLWCEVTSSIRTRDAETETSSGSDDESKVKKPPPSFVSATKVPDLGDSGSSDTPESLLELLLCLRPIHDGEAQPKKDMRLLSSKGKKKPPPPAVGETTGGTSGSGETTSAAQHLSSSTSPGPLKKRRPDLDDGGQENKKLKRSDNRPKKKVDRGLLP